MKAIVTIVDDNGDIKKENILVNPTYDNIEDHGEYIIKSHVFKFGFLEYENKGRDLLKPIPSV